MAGTVLEQMAAWIVAGRDVPLPQTASERLSIHLLDAVGAWIAGGATEEGILLARLISSPAHPAPLLSRSPLDRVVLGVATTRLTEIDDIHMASCTTPSSVLVPAALILSAHMPKPNAGAFASALSAGYEAMTRFGAAVNGPALLPRGFWPTYLVAPLAACALASRLLGLNAEKTAHALAVALTMTSGAPGRPSAGASPRWLLLGLAARTGCEAAIAAAEGYAGDHTLLDGDWMERTHAIKCDAGPLLAAASGDGAVGALSLKSYCAAKQTISAIDAFQNLLRSGVIPDAVVSVRIAVPPAYAEMIGHRNTGTRVGRITSAAHQLALAAYRPNELDSVARPNLSAEPQIAAFMGRVEVVADKSLEQYYPQRWPARVEAQLKDGRRESKLVLDAPGDPPRSGEVDARAKFHRLADRVIGNAAAKELVEACLGATEQDEALATLCAKLPN
jgi:2-methylcitrate dehydratase PrpD